MQVTIIVSKELEQWWGIEDVVVDLPKEQVEKEIIALVQEDIPAFLDGAVWNVVIDK